MFVDASALCAILFREPEGPQFRNRLKTATGAVSSHIAVFETVRAVLVKTELDYVEARHAVDELLREFGVELIGIGEAEGGAALDALKRFGKGRHPAKLNMGDCFAYGCAKANGLSLLFKGDDFSRTDITPA